MLDDTTPFENGSTLPQQGQGPRGAPAAEGCRREAGADRGTAEGAREGGHGAPEVGAPHVGPPEEGKGPSARQSGVVVQQESDRAEGA